MVTVRIWTANGERTIAAPTNGKAFDEADRLGAWRVVDAVGEVFRRLDGDWVGCGFEKTRGVSKENA